MPHTWNEELKQLLLGLIVNSTVFTTLLLVCLSLIIETLNPVEVCRRYSSRLLNIVNGLCIAVMSYILAVSFASTTHAIQGGWVINFGKLMEGKGALAQCMFMLLFFFITDIIFYFYHRISHENKWLWGVHAVHHSDLFFDSTTYLRTNFLDEPLQKLLVALPLVLLFGMPATTLPYLYMFQTLMSYFSHLNLKIQLGWFSWVISNPQWHRIHHSILPQHINKNYASTFPIIDVVFGTYVEPKRNEYPPIGLVSGEQTETLASLWAYPLSYWKKLLGGKKEAV